MEFQNTVLSSPHDCLRFLCYFHVISVTGGVNAAELLRTFNCGIGAVIIVSSSDVEAVLKLVPDERASVIGTVQLHNGGGQYTHN